MPVLWGSAETNFGTFARLARFTIRVFQLLLKYAQTIERVMQQFLFGSAPPPEVQEVASMRSRMAW